MAISISFANSDAGSAVADMNMALQGASALEQAKLLRLFFDHFNGTLRQKTPAKLAAYLENLRVWRLHDGVCVYKTSDLPCIAYAAIEYGDDTVLLLLGACRAYPGSEEEWWTNVVEPRLVHHL